MRYLLGQETETHTEETPGMDRDRRTPKRNKQRKLNSGRRLVGRRIVDDISKVYRNKTKRHLAPAVQGSGYMIRAGILKAVVYGYCGKFSVVGDRAALDSSRHISRVKRSSLVGVGPAGHEGAT